MLSPPTIARRASRFILVLALTAGLPSTAQDEAVDPLGQLEFRNIGPVNMSGRVADVEGIPGDPKVVYVGSASGGVWKTDNGGVTFEPIFGDQPVASIGDVALAPSNPGVVYVGTGEGNPRNSVSFGNGVYKSTDGGSSWEHLGLEESRYITRIVVDSLDPDHVCVGALGNIFGPSEERGVFCSWDGGRNWERLSGKGGLPGGEEHPIGKVAHQVANSMFVVEGISI